MISEKVEKKINDDIKERIEFQRGLEDLKQMPEMEQDTIDVTYEVMYKSKEILSIKFGLVSYEKF